LLSVAKPTFSTTIVVRKELVKKIYKYFFVEFLKQNKY